MWRVRVGTILLKVSLTELLQLLPVLGRPLVDLGGIDIDELASHLVREELLDYRDGHGDSPLLLELGNVLPVPMEEPRLLQINEEVLVGVAENLAAPRSYLEVAEEETQSSGAGGCLKLPRTCPTMSKRNFFQPIPVKTLTFESNATRKNFCFSSLTPGYATLTSPPCSTQ